MCLNDVLLHRCVLLERAAQNWLGSCSSAHRSMAPTGWDLSPAGGQVLVARR